MANFGLKWRPLGLERSSAIPRRKTKDAPVSKARRLRKVPVGKSVQKRRRSRVPANPAKMAIPPKEGVDTLWVFTAEDG